MKLVWSTQARRDLRELLAYIAQDSTEIAEIVNSRILDSAKRLIDMPNAGRIGRIDGTRERVVQRTPYLLLYKVDSDQLRILRVLRGARNWPGSLT